MLRPGGLLLLASLVALLAACGSASSPPGGAAVTSRDGSGSGAGASLRRGSTDTGAAARRASSTRRKVPHLAIPAHPAARTVRVPILTYHRVHVLATEFTRSVPDETVEPTVFRSEIDALARAGYHSVTQVELFAALFHHRHLPPKPVLITVDDGYIDDLKEILPVLRSRHMVATFYIITGRFREQGFLNPTEVRRLDAAGMDIGAHTRTHADLPTLPASAARREIVGSRSDLARVLGHPVYSFAYPYGAHTAAVVQEVRRAGFALAVTTQGGTHESSSAPLTMPRIHVGRSSNARSILACMSATSGCGGPG